MWVILFSFDVADAPPEDIPLVVFFEHPLFDLLMLV